MERTEDDVSSVAGVEAPEPGIVLVAVGSEPRAVLLPAKVELGRRVAVPGAERALHELADDRMSREHATVSFERGAWVIADRESRNGTFVDGERITGELRRRGDAIVRLGHTVFVLLADARGHTAALPRATGDAIVGPELARTNAQIRRHAASDALLIHGESGSGKELAARLYHDAGPRAGGPFVAVNCAALPEGVADRLLFGSKRGAFTGSIDALGHFQMADGGTLFLDEVAELDASVQAKLLRVLEAREVLPIGASAGVPIELGIVGASHRELRTAVAERRFREDLYYRLARATVHLPPLRARRVDLARLVQRDVAAAGALAPHAKLVEACLVRPWPGNVRELRAAIRAAAAEAIGAKRDVVRVEDLPAGAGLPLGVDTAVERKTTGDLDKAAVEAALARANGVISVAARALGLHRTQLYRVMEKLGIERDARDDT